MSHTYTHTLFLESIASIQYRTSLSNAMFFGWWKASDKKQTYDDLGAYIAGGEL